MWYVYILQCSDNSLYTGVALDDVERRLQEHLSGKGSRYVRAKLPATIVYQERHRKKTLALSREAEIKGWTHRRKLELIHS